MSEEYVPSVRIGYNEGFQMGYEAALDDVIQMIRDNFPDPNPLASIFTPYIGDIIIENIENMQR